MFVNNDNNGDNNNDNNDKYREGRLCTLPVCVYTYLPKISRAHVTDRGFCVPSARTFTGQSASSFVTEGCARRLKSGRR